MAESKATAPTDAVPSNMVALVYGTGGTRKSTLGNTAPRPIKVLAFDGGYNRSRFAQDALYEPATWAEVLDYTKDIQGGTLLVDTAGKMVDSLKAHARSKSTKNRQFDGTMTPAGWGAVGEVFLDWFNDLRQRCNMIFTAHDTTSADGQKKVIPSIQGNMVPQAIIGECALVGWTFPEEANLGDSPTYAVTWMAAFDRPHGKGDFLGVQRIGENPVQMMQNFESAKQDIRERAEESAAESASLNALLDRIAQASLKELTGIAEDMASAGVVAKELAKPAFRARIDELGAVWDAKAKRYALADEPDTAETPAPKAKAKKKPAAKKPKPKPAAKTAKTDAKEAEKPAHADETRGGETEPEPDEDNMHAGYPDPPQPQPKAKPKAEAADDLASKYGRMVKGARNANMMTFLREQIEKLPEVPADLSDLFAEKVTSLGLIWLEDRYVPLDGEAQQQQELV